MMDSETVIKLLINHNVPRYVQHIKDRGGVSAEEWAWVRCEDDNPDYPIGMIMRADELLLYPKNHETFIKSAFILVLTLAILSFFPYGVSFFGSRFCSELENYFEDETES